MAYTAGMHVTRTHHRRVVFALAGALFLLSIILILAILQMGIFNIPKIPPVEEYIQDPTSEHLEAPYTPFLQEEEVVIVEHEAVGKEEVALPVKKVLFEYVEVVDSCNQYFVGECLNVRSGPGTEYSVVTRLRNNMVLKIAGKVERDGHVWYKIEFDEWLRYPERIKGDWYVAADYVEVLLDEGDRTIWDQENTASTTTKRIIIDRSEQILYAYEGDELFMWVVISTGIELTPTPRGTFSIFKKTPSRYMQGPIPGITNKYYDLPGVPWNLYFTHGGAVIHGAYWHDNFGQKWSNGCVNIIPEQARKLYNWAELGTRVIVQ